MRIHRSKPSAGNTLVLVLFMTSLMGISLASYLILVRNQNLSVMRSLSWNTCIPVIEAGIEEALTHLNDDGMTNMLSSGWNLGTNGYTKTRYLGTSYYTVTISTNDPPNVTSYGYVQTPSNPTVPMGWLATIGLDSESSTQYNARAVQVTTIRNSIWNHAMVAKGSINLNGNNITTDSFDSSDPNHSTNGLYDSSKRKDHGDVATDSTIIDSLSVGNANLYGRAATGPGGSIAIGPNGVVGDLAWHQSNTGIEPGWTNNDMNVYFPSVTVPFSSGFTPQSGSIGSTSYNYLLNGGSTGATYVMSNLSLSGKQVMMVTNQVKLLITGSLSVSGNAYIEIAQGSSLYLYMQGSSASIGGNGMVNDTGNATNFVYMGTPSNTSLSFSGNGTFTGLIYAPSAAFTLGGGGNNTQDFVGASITGTVSMNGHFNFHYDEALGKFAWGGGYLINSWNEM
jgi:hypothetical protein